MLVGTLLNSLAGPGALDGSFAGGVSGPVYAAAVQPDGRVVVAGSFSSAAGVSRYGIARLFPSGAPDTSFQYNMGGISGGTVKCLAIQSDGRIVIGGTFTSVNGTIRYGVARLNANGAVDTKLRSPLLFLCQCGGRAE